MPEEAGHFTVNRVEALAFIAYTTSPEMERSIGL